MKFDTTRRSFGCITRSIGVKNSRDPDIELVLTKVVEEQRLAAALALVVTSACTNWIGVAPISFGLRVFAGVAIYLACGCLENSTAQTLGEAKHVDRTMYGCLSSLHRIMLIVDRRGGARKVPDLVCFHI